NPRFQRLPEVHPWLLRSGAPEVNHGLRRCGNRALPEAIKGGSTRISYTSRKTCGDGCAGRFWPTGSAAEVGIGICAAQTGIRGRAVRRRAARQAAARLVERLRPAEAVGGGG